MEEEEEKERLLKLSVKASTKALQNPNRAGCQTHISRSWKSGGTDGHY